MQQLNVEKQKETTELAGKYTAIPEELKALPNWVVATDHKIPVNPTSGYYAKTNKSETWSAYDKALSFLSEHYNEEVKSKRKSSNGVIPRYTGIGFVFDNRIGLVGIDIDHCLDDNGNVLDNAVQEIIDKTDSYVEKSKSGHGLHIVVKGNKVGKYCRCPITDTIGIEIYNEKRYFYITGNLYIKGRNAIADGQDLVDYVTDKYFITPYKSKQIVGDDSCAESIDMDDENVEISDIVWNNIAALCNKNEKFRKSWNGERFEHCDANGELRHDESGQDFYLLCKLAPIVNYNQAMLKNVFLKSPYVASKDYIHTEKLKRKDYIDNSVMNATLAVQSNSKATMNKAQKQDNCNNIDATHTADKNKNTPVAKYEMANPEDKELLKYGFTDIDNADRFLKVYKNKVLYCIDDSSWYVYNGKIWAKDKSKNLLKGLGKKLYRRMCYVSKQNLDNLKKKCGEEYSAEIVKAEAIHKSIKKLGSIAVQSAMYSAAESDVTVEKNEFNTERYLLPVNNGIVNLQTGELLDFSHKYKFTEGLSIDYKSDAGTPTRFIQFLDEILSGDKGLVEYLLAFLGYCLTGEVKESKFLICYGGGGNGKSVLFNLIKRILGGFADSMNKGSILKKVNADGPNSGIMKVRDTRYVQVDELNKNDVLDTSLIKALTGGEGETISARDLYCSEQSFEVKFKLIMNTNFLPKLNWYDYAIERRVVVIPFIRKFGDDEIDLNLSKKLEAEKEQILALLVKKAIEYYANGLPKVPMSSKEAYHKALIEDEPLKAFLKEKVQITNDSKNDIGGSNFCEEVKKWCYAKGLTNEHIPSQQYVGHMIRKVQGIHVYENGYHQARYAGILIKPDVETASA